MYTGYSDNRNQQILLALLKAYGINKVIASPGGTNPALVASFQYDSFFEVYSCVDERSAAYMACGLSEETGEPVVICCTGATASRNYMPALTEAFYRKLPIIAITCSRPLKMIGQLIPQVTDRTVYPNDIFVDGVQLEEVISKEMEEECAFLVNRVLLSSKNHGGGPVHFNVVSKSQSCGVKTLPSVPIIKIYHYDSTFPNIPSGKIAIFVGSHKRMTENEISAINNFCAVYDAIVLCDHTSNYYGNYRVDYSLIGTQKHNFGLLNLRLLIHIGNISGDYITPKCIHANEIWRVSEDGIIRKTFGHINAMFEIPEKLFFHYYTNVDHPKALNSYYTLCENLYNELYEKIPDLPFSNIWVAKELSPLMPHSCTLHFAILNSLRSWNFFKIDKSILTMCNVGGFGIDGCTSSLIGASLANSNKLYFLVTGDLAFFYDLNVLGNRHIGPNVRIILVNTGNGAEFLHFQSPEYEVGVRPFIAAEGHFGNHSKEVVKKLSESLGFEYCGVNDKQSFLLIEDKIVDKKIGEKPLLVEVFIKAEEQSKAWEKLSNIANINMSDILTMYSKKLKNSSIAKSIKSKLVI